MLPSTSLSSLPQEIIKNPHYSRKLLLQSYTNQALSPNDQQMINPSPNNGNHTTFAANVVLILSILICSAVITLVVNSLIKCMVKCLSLHNREHNFYLDMINHQKPRTGVDNKAMKTLPVVKYSSENNIQGLGTECVICLSEFKVAETIRILPKCNHGFHVKCIDKWLSSHSSCPTCRQSLVDSCDTVIECRHHQSTTLSSDLKLPGLDTECVICLSEFAAGDKIRLLPKCQHGFHVRCIDKWLNSHSSCPTCRHCLIETCQKIVGCDQASSSQPDQQPPPTQAVIVNILPLEREDLVRCFRDRIHS